MRRKEIKSAIEELLEKTVSRPVIRQFKFSRGQVEDCPNLLEVCIEGYLDNLDDLQLDYVVGMRVEETFDKDFGIITSLRLRSTSDIRCIVEEPQEVMVHAKIPSVEWVQSLSMGNDRKRQIQEICDLFEVDRSKYLGGWGSEITGDHVLAGRMQMFMVMPKVKE